MTDIVDRIADLIIDDHVKLMAENRALRVKVEQMMKLLTDAERVLDWGEPEPKPVLKRIRSALIETKKEGWNG